MNPSSTCLAAVKSFESCRLAIYFDQNGFPTIGWGHKLTSAEISSGVYSQGIGQATADNLFLQDIQPRVQQTNTAFGGIPYTPTQGQFDAAFDFLYNLGAGSLNIMLAHGIENVPENLPKWVYANHQIDPGLVRRRQTELQWWTSD